VSLENLGLVAVEYEFLDDIVADARFGAAATEAGLAADEAGRLVRAMLDFMRRRSGTSGRGFACSLLTRSLPGRSSFVRLGR
jgi:hypothetical protein